MPAAHATPFLRQDSRFLPWVAGIFREARPLTGLYNDIAASAGSCLERSSNRLSHNAKKGYKMINPTTGTFPFPKAEPFPFPQGETFPFPKAETFPAFP